MTNFCPSSEKADPQAQRFGRAGEHRCAQCSAAAEDDRSEARRTVQQNDDPGQNQGSILPPAVYRSKNIAFFDRLF